MSGQISQYEYQNIPEYQSPLNRKKNDSLRTVAEGAHSTFESTAPTNATKKTETTEARYGIT
jgi:hypothetical protein